MWRTVIVSSGEKISLESNRMVLYNGYQRMEVPIEDLYSVIIEHEHVRISTSVLNALSSNNVHVFLCDNRHLPITLVLPLNTHYRVLSVLRKQINLDPAFKNEVWKRITKAKIENQARVLDLVGCSRKVSCRIRQLADEVEPGDRSNREGIAAKVFFREIYGVDFIRFSVDVINSALNYGYAIIRAAVSKSLVGYGFNCALGIHHVGEYNPFNLADDLMEPLRPIVDLWVRMNNEDLVDNLSKRNRVGLVNIVNQTVLIERKRTKIRYALDKYIKSFVTSIDRANPDLLLFPMILAPEIQEDEEDEQPLYENLSLF